MKTANLPITHRVRSGVRWMDAHYPDWTSRIDLDDFDMLDIHRCVLGQTTGYFYNVVGPLLSDEDAEVLGFSLPNAETPGIGIKQYTTLTDLWREEITSRLTTS